MLHMSHEWSESFCRGILRIGLFQFQREWVNLGESMALYMAKSRGYSINVRGATFKGDWGGGHVFFTQRVPSA